MAGRRDEAIRKKAVRELACGPTGRPAGRPRPGHSPADCLAGCMCCGLCTAPRCRCQISSLAAWLALFLSFFTRLRSGKDLIIERGVASGAGKTVLRYCATSSNWMPSSNYGADTAQERILCPPGCLSDVRVKLWARPIDLLVKIDRSIDWPVEMLVICYASISIATDREGELGEASFGRIFPRCLEQITYCLAALSSKINCPDVPPYVYAYARTC